MFGETFRDRVTISNLEAFGIRIIITCKFIEEEETTVVDWRIQGQIRKEACPRDCHQAEREERTNTPKSHRDCNGHYNRTPDLGNL